MALENLAEWSGVSRIPPTVHSVSASCGASDKPEKKPAACGSSCGAQEKPEKKPASCGSSCGASDKPADKPAACGAGSKA